VSSSSFSSCATSRAHRRRAGRRQLVQETRDWNRMADIIGGILKTPPEQA
jgi:hypothetical protein